MLDAKWKAHDEDMAVKADLYRKALEQYLPAEEVEEMEAYRKRLQMPEKPVHHASWWHNKLREYGLRPFEYQAHDSAPRHGRRRIQTIRSAGLRSHQSHKAGGCSPRRRSR